VESFGRGLLPRESEAQFGPILSALESKRQPWLQSVHHQSYIRTYEALYMLLVEEHHCSSPQVLSIEVWEIVACS